MPVETLKVAMKPVNFFSKNPAIDVPPSTQEFNKSTLLSELHHQGTAEGSIDSSDAVCCSGPAPTSKL